MQCTPNSVHTKFYTKFCTPNSAHQIQRTSNSAHTKFCTPNSAHTQILHTQSSSHTKFCTHQILRTLNSAHAKFCTPNSTHQILHTHTKFCTPNSAHTKFCTRQIQHTKFSAHQILHQILRTANSANAKFCTHQILHTPNDMQHFVLSGPVLWFALPSRNTRCAMSSFAVSCRVASMAQHAASSLLIVCVKSSIDIADVSTSTYYGVTCVRLCRRIQLVYFVNLVSDIRVCGISSRNVISYAAWPAPAWRRRPSKEPQRRGKHARMHARTHARKHSRTYCTNARMHAYVRTYNTYGLCL